MKLILEYWKLISAELKQRVLDHRYHCRMNKTNFIPFRVTSTEYNSIKKALPNDPVKLFGVEVTYE